MLTQDIVPEGWKAARIDGFIGLMGPLLRATDQGDQDRYALQTDERHTNAIGLIHGGVLTSLLDQVMAISAWRAADRRPTVTVQMETRFLSAAKAGDFLEMEARIRHKTQSMIFAEAEISGPSGVVAAASCVLKVTSKEGVQK
ncbi:PaaI family thioesterase [Roseibium suaedae]|uniref:Uncharacterized domain 1-containing protein n=1 Tax=Roseibium suaedae TaxID=735517 RepID=A0A1M7PHD5_9HYPH|nr:PaaI family thioesterase [Roseibium suaedae]SHN16464.1 uncharacterized domain 1-containing protein [Roseibium suaedae]